MKTRNTLARVLFSASALAIGAAGLAAPAMAQGGDDEDGTENVILVLGTTKQQENIQDVPTTITAFDAGALEANGIDMVEDIATFTPGFNIRGAGNNPTAFALSMRGQIQNDNIATLEPSVGIYLDEVYIARAYGLNTDLVDVESVQVLKGPQGTLFGRNTSAGAVLIQTANPKYNETSGMVKATYGRFDERTGTAVVNLGLSDTVAIRGAIYYSKRDGFKTDVNTGQKYEGYETLNGRVKIGFRPTDNLEILLSGEWYDGDVVGPARQNLFFNAPAAFGAAGKAFFDGTAAADRAKFGNDEDLVAITSPAAVAGAPAQGLFNTMKTQTYNAKVILDTFFGQVKWISGIRKIKGANLIDLDGSSVVGHFTQGFQDLKQFSTELQVTGSAMNDMLDFAAGITYFHESGFDQSRSNLFGGTFRASDPRVPAQFVGAVDWSNFSGTINNDSFGMYGQGNFHVTDALSIIAGLRYSIDDKGVIAQSGDVANNTDTYVFCSPTTVAVPCIRNERSDTFKNLSYTIGLDYKLTEDILFYAKHSKGYRSGAQQLRTLTLADTAPAQPEIVHEQEVGLKTSFWDGRGRFNIAGYHNKVKGAQRSSIFNINGTSQTVLENADTETWGVEADFSIEVVDGLTFYASGSLTDPKYTKYDGFAVGGASPNQVLTPLDKSDNFFVGIVKEQFSLGTSYTADLGSMQLDANLVYAWQGDFHQDGTPFNLYTSTGLGGLGLTAQQAAIVQDGTVSDSVGITNARLALSFGPDREYSIAVWGQNIFNERTQNYTLLLSNIYLGTNYNPPATYGVTLSAKFGGN